jgi:hypothetical protein
MRRHVVDDASKPGLLFVWRDLYLTATAYIVVCIMCHSLNSGRDYLEVCGRRRVQDAAVKAVAEEVEPLVAPIEPLKGLSR